MTRATALFAVALFAVTGTLARADATGAARLGDSLAQVMTREYPAALAATARPGNLSPESAQILYDAARDLENALPPAANASCRALLAALRSFAAAEIATAEWFDRLDSGRSAAASRAGIRSASQVAAARPSCRERATVKPAAAPLPLLAPGSGEAFTGVVEARAPAGAVLGEIHVNGKRTRNHDSGARSQGARLALRFVPARSASSRSSSAGPPAPRLRVQPLDLSGSFPRQRGASALRRDRTRVSRGSSPTRQRDFPATADPGSRASGTGRAARGTRRPGFRRPRRSSWG